MKRFVVVMPLLALGLALVLAGVLVGVVFPSSAPTASPKVAGPASAAALVTVPSPPVIRAATAGIGSATANWTAPSDGGSAILGYHVRVVDGGTGKVTLVLRDTAASATSLTFTGLAGGQIRFQVDAWNAKGTSGVSATSNAVTPAARVVPPAVRVVPPAVRVVPPAVRVVPPAVRVVPPAVRVVPPAVRVVPPAPRVVPPAAALYTVSYLTLGNGKRIVSRWNPCRTHTYKVNLAAVPTASRPTLLAEARNAVGVLTAKSGIPFVYQGETGEVPQPGSHANQSAELIIAFTSPDKTSYGLSGSTLGVGGAATKWATTYSGTTPTYTGGIYRGFVVIDTPGALRMTPGFGAGVRRGNLLLHELGHAVGLGHVNGNPALLMSLSMTSRTPNGFAGGDLAGLAVVGRPAGCVAGM